MHSLLGWVPSRWRRCHILLFDARICLCRFVVIEKRRLAVGINSWWHAWVRSYAWPWWLLCWHGMRVAVGGRAVAPVSSNSYLVSSFYSVWLSLACSRHVTGSFASQNLTYFAPTRQWFPERTISSQATCCNVLNNDAPIALYLY